ncbi:MAG TPA: hypothetical protein PLX06_12465, partial [Fimbriimonadaceae bacterium]|nr:hypothetical protein [Fimbriimonadaceae bacterium]
MPADTPFRIAGIWRRPSREAGFIDWPEASVSMVSAGDGAWRLTPSAPAGVPCSALRIRIVLTFSDLASVRLHHPSLVRMFGMGSIGVIEDWREGPRSPMAADHHEAMRPGEQEFATPPWVWLWDSSASFFLRAETETHAKMTVEWGVEGGEVFLDLGWERQGSKGFVSCENWPREVVGLKRVESPLPPAGWVVPGGGRGQG